jgi:UDP-N-acetylmuramoylalanine--D-glutamate ligase
VLARGGVDAVVGGNIGTPAISLLSRSSPQTVMVLEVSSFQLETIRSFHPKLAAILNVTPDHLDRHRTLTAYVDAKARIFENQSLRDFALLNADDPRCVELAGRTRAPVYWFSRRRQLDQGAFVLDERIVYSSEGEQEDIMRIAEIPLKGSHNLENVLAAVVAGRLLGCEAEKIRSAVQSFKAVEHRLEYIRTVHGVDYYNDSKATNVDATIKALESFPANIHLILGGKDKGSDYRVLAPLIHERVRCVYTIGAAAEKIESQIERAATVVHSGTLERAVRQAAESARAGDVVLLAPACASFDQFENYEHRGMVFKELVARLPSGS